MKNKQTQKRLLMRKCKGCHQIAVKVMSRELRRKSRHGFAYRKVHLWWLPWRQGRHEKQESEVFSANLLQPHARASFLEKIYNRFVDVLQQSSKSWSLGLCFQTFLRGCHFMFSFFFLADYIYLLLSL